MAETDKSLFWVGRKRTAISCTNDGFYSSHNSQRPKKKKINMDTFSVFCSLPVTVFGYVQLVLGGYKITLEFSWRFLFPSDKFCFKCDNFLLHTMHKRPYNFTQNIATWEKPPRNDLRFISWNCSNNLICPDVNLLSLQLIWCWRTKEVYIF
jgi:hypothetical protein